MHHGHFSKVLRCWLVLSETNSKCEPQKQLMKGEVGWQDEKVQQGLYLGISVTFLLFWCFNEKQWWCKMCLLSLATSLAYVLFILASFNYSTLYIIMVSFVLARATLCTWAVHKRWSVSKLMATVHVIVVCVLGLCWASEALVEEVSSRRTRH